MRPWLDDFHTDGLVFHNTLGEVVAWNPFPFWAALWELSRILIAEHSSEKILWDMSSADVDAIIASSTE